MMAGIGKQNRVNCAKCKGKGRCDACSGKGREEKACDSCGGSGQRTALAKVKSVYLSLLKGERVDENRIVAMAPPERRGESRPKSYARPSVPATEPSTTSYQRPKSGDTQKQMDAYVNSMSALDKLFAEGKAQESSLTEATALPDRYMGKLLKSRAYIISCYPRQVVVATRSSSTRAEGTSLIPRSLEVGMKAETFYKKVRNNKRVSITYGIVSKDNCTLFDIEAL